MKSITFRRFHPGGPKGRASYGVAGVPGIVVFDLTLFPEGVAPAIIELSCELAEPKAKKADGVTSAKVAAANVEQAAVKGDPIATPAQVAQVAGAVGTKVVEKAKAEVAKPKAHASKVG